MIEKAEFEASLRNFFKELNKVGRCVEVKDLPRIKITNGINDGTPYNISKIIYNIFNTYLDFPYGDSSSSCAEFDMERIGWNCKVNGLIWEDPYHKETLRVNSLNLCACIVDDFKQLDNETLERHMIILKKMSKDSYWDSDADCEKFLIKILKEILISRFLEVL